MGAIEAIPEDVVWADWLRTVVGESRYITEALSDHWAAEAAVGARKHSEFVRSCFRGGRTCALDETCLREGTWRYLAPGGWALPCDACSQRAHSDPC